MPWARASCGRDDEVEAGEDRREPEDEGADRRDDPVRRLRGEYGRVEGPAGVEAAGSDRGRKKTAATEYR
jgi:hypothetical protein